MLNMVTFRSSKFPSYEGEEDEINPGLWGRRLAEHLAASLRTRGFACGTPIAEDWGYFLPVTIDGQRLALCCGHQNGDDDEFLIFTNPSKPRVWRWFRQIDLSPQLSALTQALATVLESDTDIHSIAWSETENART